MHGSLAEQPKAVAQGAIPKGRGFEPHSCQFLLLSDDRYDSKSRQQGKPFGKLWKGGTSQRTIAMKSPATIEPGTI